MRLLRPASAVSFPHIVAVAGLIGVAVLTLIDRGATRAYSTPWIALLWVAQLAPLVALFVRTLMPGPPFHVPSRAWLALAALFGGGVLLSALLSPYRSLSLLSALTPLAGVAAFLLAHDWIERDPDRRMQRLLQIAGIFAAAIVVLSLTRWSVGLLTATPDRPLSTWLEHRNEHPLGHSNYTAGLALLCLPWLGTLAWRTRGVLRLGWMIATLLGLAMLITSGSRGGLIGFAVLLLVALLHARLGWKRLSVWLVVTVGFSLTLALAQPRLRATLLNPALAAELLHRSTVQRSAMATAGVRMGLDRPLLGWGPGTTPLAFPRYRAGLDGGVENALQLHSTPVQLWADLGIIGLLCATGLLALAGREIINPPRRPAGAGSLHATASAALAAYAAYSLTDYQLDVPVFPLGLAVAAALLARSAAGCAGWLTARTIGGVALVAVGIIGTGGAQDPAPELNSRALELARESAGEEPAIALLRQSLSLNPDQEIAHFNLGWLLLVRAPAAAEKHFLAAAHLVPDKGGVYFGLALARLNQPHIDPFAVAHPLALECLNDPLFLTSPWWRQPAIGALRQDMLAALRMLGAHASAALAADDDPRARDIAYVLALADWLEGSGSLATVLAHSHTAERVRYFAARPAVPDLAGAPIRRYRRERPGYPVLMRNLDLPSPVDLFDVQENALAAEELRELFPPKGWLPAPLLIALLAEPDSAGFPQSVSKQ